MAINLVAEELPPNLGFEPSKGDSFLYDARAKVAVMEVKGPWRPTQEDAVQVQSLPDFDSLPRALQREALLASFAHVNQLTCQLESGSTLAVGVAWVDHLSRLHATSMHVGDTEIYIVIMEEGEVVYVKRLNALLHSATEPAEYHRLIKTGHVVVNGRVGGRLKPSRALGDAHVLKGREPDIDYLRDEDNDLGIQLQENQEAYMLVGCDGMFEALTEDVLEDGETIMCEDDDEVDARKENFIADAMTLAKGDEYVATQLLIQGAYGFGLGSTDNMSTILMRIMPGKKPVAAVMGDGHHGAETAQMAVTAFFPAFCAWIKRLLYSAKKQFLVDLAADAKGLSKAAILDRFNEIKHRKGKYAFIYVQRHQWLDELRIWMRPRHNTDENGQWITHTFHEAKETLKRAYLQAPGSARTDDYLLLESELFGTAKSLGQKRGFVE